MGRSVGHLGESDIRLLRIFVAVAESGGLAKAQSALNLGLSTISGYLSQLELRLGTSLCQRGRRGFLLTDEGKAVYTASKSLLAAHEAFRSAVGSIHGDLIGEIRIGVVDNIIFDEALGIADVISRFQKRYGKVLISLFTLPPNLLESALMDGAVHIGIGQYFRKLPSIRYENLHADPLTLYCARGHPFFDRAPDDITLEEVEMARFANRAYIDSDRLSDSRPKFQEAAVGYSVEAILIFILSGMFISYLPNKYASHWVKKNMLKPVLPERFTIAADIAVAVPNVSKMPPVVRAFMTELGVGRQKTATD
jgi:DNA-binding transcriptional LysR family regulator